jgi:hypothetical protein
MSLTFPSNPSTGDTYTAANNTWYWDGVKWHTYGNQGAIGPAGATGSAGNDLPKITAVTYADSGYSSNGASSIAPSTAGYIYLTGSNFQSGCSVYVNGTRMTTTYVSSTRVNVAVTGQSIASYHIYFYNPDGGTTVKVNGLAIANPIVVTGGTVTYDGNYTVRTFTSTETLSVTGGNLTVDVLLVGGGGGGARDAYYGGGGGGAGGLVYLTSQSLPAYPNYSVIVGGGGAAATDWTTQASDGTYSWVYINGANDWLFAPAHGGGGAGRNPSSGYGSNGNGRTGGCGGGATYGPGGSTGGSPTYSPYTGYNGYAGGNVSGNSAGAGGGGAGAVGSSTSGDTIYGASGGIGRQINITGTPTYYASGGGGGGVRGGDNRVAGGGGRGAGNSDPTNGDPNSGGGGGGGNHVNYASRSGGSGVVIIRYLT